MPTVLITTSGTGSRLGKKTQYTNKSLMKIGDTYAITHILKLYPKDTEFIITIGHYGSHVKQYLSLAHHDLNIKFVEVDTYEGEGSSLAYSILQAKDSLQKPFYFHCCDTLLKEPFLTSTENCVYVCKGSSSNSYSSISVNDKKVVSINNKSAESFDYLYIGLAYIQNFRLYWNLLDTMYASNRNTSSLGDVQVMQAMLAQGESFTFQVLHQWYDTGNEESYQKTNSAFPKQYNVLDKPDESLSFLEDKVIKFFFSSDVCQKRVTRGNLLYPSCPKILGSTANFFSMEKVVGSPLSEVESFGYVKTLLDWSWKTIWSKKDTNDSYVGQCLRFYKVKTETRLTSLLFDETNKVNGIETGSWKDLLAQIDFGALATKTFTYFHGDFILENILLRPNGDFCYLDWRQEFDGNLDYGDMYYDLAKLRHNIYFNHTNILENLYSVRHESNEVFVDIKCNYLQIQQEYFIQEFCREKHLDFAKVRILTAIIWLNMAPLYEGKLSEFLFYFGKYNLALALRTPITIL